MGQREILLTISKLLTELQIPYLLTGGFAASYYGYPRATHDIDFVLEIEMAQYPKLEKALRQLPNSFLVDWEEVKKGIKQHLHFNVLHVDSGIKVDFWSVKKSDFNVSRFKRKKKAAIFNEKIWLVSPEDLILIKLKWCKEVRSERHMRDCVGIIKIQEEKLDNRYLLHWAKKLGVENLYKEVSSPDSNYFKKSFIFSLPVRLY